MGNNKGNWDVCRAMHPVQCGHFTCSFVIWVDGQRDSHDEHFIVYSDVIYLVESALCEESYLDCSGWSNGLYCLFDSFDARFKVPPGFKAESLLDPGEAILGILR